MWEITTSVAMDLDNHGKYIGEKMEHWMNSSGNTGKQEQAHNL